MREATGHRMADEVCVGSMVRQKHPCAAAIVPDVRNMHGVIDCEAGRTLASNTCDIWVWGVRTSSSACTAGGRAWKARPSTEFSRRFRSAAVCGVHPTGMSGGMVSQSGSSSAKVVKGKWDSIGGRKVQIELYLARTNNCIGTLRCATRVRPGASQGAST